MNDILYSYMTKRFSDKYIEDFHSSMGPVVTFSRAAGCSLSQLANALASKLNEGQKDKTWDVVSKEILHHSAEILKLQPDTLKSIFKPKNRNLFDEIVQAFISGEYHLEKRMIKTVISVIHNFGVEGHKIIVGRAANIICSDIPNSLHIRIDAPLNWRIEKVMKIKEFSKEEAVNCINQTEKNRDNFRRSVKGDVDQSDTFDLIINQATFSKDQIIDLIINAMKIKKLI